MTKQRVLKLLPFLLALALAGIMAWYYDVYVHWNANVFPFAVAASVLAFLALAVSSVWPGKARQGTKCLYILGWLVAFVAAEQGLSYLINNVVYRARSPGASIAMQAVLPLLALLAILLLIRPWLALSRKAKIAAGISALASVVLLAGFISPDIGGVHSLYSDLAYTFAYSTEKTKVDEHLSRMKTIRVTMGKNEREGFQFILRGRSTGSQQYCVELSDAVSGDGNTIPVSMFKEHYIYAGAGKDAGMYPDALVPYPINQDTLEITAAHRNQGFYIELRTDADTPAGIYTGKISVHQRRQVNYVWETTATPVEADFTVEVLDVTYPVAAYNDTAVGIDYSPQFYALGGVEQGTPEGDALYKQTYDYLLDHKISGYRLPYDILSGDADAYMDDPRVKSFTIPYSGDDAQLQEYYRKVQSNPEWARKGYFYPIDEPGDAAAIQSYYAITGRLAELCPGYHMVTPMNKWKFGDAGQDFDNLAIQDGRSDIICPQSNTFDRQGFPAAVQKRVADNGDRAWWYVCCGPTGDYNNMFIHLQGTRHRLLFWQQYQQNITGLLYWDCVYWEKANPWLSSVTWDSYSACGDGSWFYPGPAVGLRGPVPSLRLKNIADGLEDYDLLRMAEEAFGREYCLKKAAQLSKSLTKSTGDPAKVERVRVSILKDLADAAQ